ncbi:MAG: hypothetical protein H7Z41_11915 [Cytophagales bacterium]|nr:hypothetical protein [Armatimonadota bacterium]
MNSPMMSRSFRATVLISAALLSGCGREAAENSTTAPSAAPPAVTASTIAPVPAATGSAETGGTAPGGAVADSSTASPSLPDAPTAPSSDPLSVAASASPAASNGLTDKYIVKLTPYPLTEVRFVIALNGEQIGDYSSKGEQDITSFVKPGKNTGTLSYIVTPGGPRYGMARFALGVQRDGKWNSIVNADVNGRMPNAKRNFSFVAK